MHNKHKVEAHIQWTLNSGSCSFWWDNWLGVGPLAQFSADNNRFNNTTVAEFWHEGQWNWSMLIQQVPSCQLTNILATELHIQQDLPDQAIWKLNIDGKFSCSSAWNVIREKRIKTRFNSFIWHKSIPFKSSFLLWRTLRGQVWIQSITPSTMNTLLPTCATALLQLLESPQTTAPYSNSSGNDGQLNTIMKHIGCYYGLRQYSFVGTYEKIDVLANMEASNPIWPSNWRDLIQLGDKCEHDTKVTLVRWIKPPNQWVKINTDGTALSNPGRTGAGGILRDQDGEMLIAFATPLGEGYRNVLLEVDSQLLVDWIMHKTNPYWSINTQIMKLQALIKQTHEFRYKHTFREANFVADSLSKHSHKITSPQLYFNRNQLPKEARAYYQLDKLEMASSRRRKIKKILEPPLGRVSLVYDS
ncbi:hypothetical protein KY285_030274 [Solanum tuberosum]|nr:hypothetical protein KY285_030274 [Solanum tuberosum]